MIPTPTLLNVIRSTCLRIPPQWPLGDIVAVNPYLGYADGDVLAAEELLQRRAGTAALPGWPHLQRAWAEGEFTLGDLEHGHQEAATKGPPPPLLSNLVAGLAGETPTLPPLPICKSAAANLRAGIDWSQVVREHLGRFLAAHTDQGVARWSALQGDGLYPTWRHWMRHDPSLEILGLSGARAWIADLPTEAEATIAHLLAGLGVEESAHGDYLACLLAELPGWAGTLRQQAWVTDQASIGQLPALLAIRLAYDGVLHARLGARPAIPSASVPAAITVDRLARHAALLAWEHAWRRGLCQRLVSTASVARPTVQAVFCIDVRSEPMRRHLEAVDPGIETYGFAGFFAMPVAVVQGGNTQEQCPVLLMSGAKVALPAAPAKPWQGVLGSFRRSPAGGFSYMETIGLSHGWDLVRTGLGLGKKAPTDGHEHLPLDLQPIPTAQRLALLRGMLKNLGLAKPYARIVLLCGHGSTVTNNPQGAALACGACGGHSGAINARLAARLYNDAALRAALGDEAPPAESLAMAAVHDTCTDAIRLLDTASVPDSHAADLVALQRSLEHAAVAQRRQRAATLPGSSSSGDDDQIMRQVQQRSQDWAELRPEWALADNAAFIAAPRHLTAGQDLGGRCFLHSYDEQLDPDQGVLTLILTAPVVVASWINLQYYGSSIDPAHLGSGNKAIHNVVGGIGVTCGGDGDLQPGLSWQSVHDGRRFRHRPQRLQVFVAAQPSRIDAVVAGHQHLNDLVRHGWIHLHAIDLGERSVSRRLPSGAWEALPAAT